MAIFNCKKFFDQSLLSMTITSLSAMPFLLRPCKESLKNIFFADGRGNSRGTHLTLILCEILGMIFFTFFFVKVELNLDKVLTFISGVTSSLVIILLKRCVLLFLLSFILI